MPDSFDYTTGTNSENVRLLQALIDDAPEYTEETNSRNANILKSIINNTEYTDAPQSEIEELLLRLKAKIGGEIEVDELNVTENGTYDAGVNKAYNPVKVELPLSSKTITENGTYTASDDNLAGFDEVTVAVEGFAKKSISNTPTDIATFNASALPMPSLTVGIEAVQDLHGYDNPWVGGSGKNKLKNEYSGTTWVSVDEYGVVTINGTVPSVQWISINTQVTLKAGTYTLSGTPSNAPTGMYIYDDSSFGGWSDTNGQGATKTFQEETTGRIAIRVPAGTYNNIVFKPMIEVGSTKTTFAPYSNICPINGWDEVNVAVSPTTDVEDGTTYTTTLKDGQGNPMVCYGGSVDVVNGVLMVEWIAVSLGNINYTKSQSGLFQTNEIASAVKKSSYSYAPTGYIKSSHFREIDSTSITGPQGSNPSPDGVMAVSSSGILYFNYWAVTDVADFKTAMANATLVYELATPITIQLTPTAVKSLLGTNNLWADSGDIQSGEYMEAL